MTASNLAALELEHRLAKAEFDLNSERTARLEAEKQIKTLEARLAKVEEWTIAGNIIHYSELTKELEQITGGGE